MNKSVGRVLAFIIAWLFTILLFTFFVQSRTMFGANPVIRARQEVVEAFQVQKPLEDMVEASTHDMNPADAELSNQRESYSLLGKWLKANDSVASNNPILNLAKNDYKAINNVEMGVGTLPTDPLIKNAAGCYEVDFQTALEKTGDFRQLTNNYKRGDPDSCSAPRQELATTFYTVTPVPNVGAPQRVTTIPPPDYTSCPKGDRLLDSA